MSETEKSEVTPLSQVPRVAILGRPNVGKSTLFNILTNTRKSVVKNQPGVTRDLVIAPAEIWGKHFELIDTGGITEATDLFSQLIREKVEQMIDSVDLVILVMDGKAGLIPEDREVLKIVRQSQKPFLIVVNKVDRQHEEDMILAEFYEFEAEIVATAFEQRRGLAELLEWLHKRLPEMTVEKTEVTSVAIVGKPNAGKSSLVNALLNEPRMMVSPIAGTTVDSVDTPFVYNGKPYILVDTAGLRKSAKRDDDVEIIAAFKSQEAIRKAQIVLLVIDSLIGPTDQDSRILQTILEDHKAPIVIFNKSDLAKDQIDKYRSTLIEKMEEAFHFYDDIPVVFTSALHREGLNEVLNRMEWMSEKLKTRISTSDLNDFFFEAIRKAPAPVYGNNNVKFYYITQTLQKPPSFIAFANHPQGVDNSYRRFLTKRLKEHFDLKGVPVRIFAMSNRRGIQ